MRLVILSVLIIGSLGGPAYQTLSVNEDGTYQFSYETGIEGGSHFRTEQKGPDGTVIGKYSYKDPAGGYRVVSYRADETGFASNENNEVPHPAAASEQPVTSEETVKPEGLAKDDSGKDDETLKQNSPPVTEAPEEDDEEEEEKPLKLEEPTDDGPPEGFPIGFFSGQFSALRRLPEPVKKEDSAAKKEKNPDEVSTDVTANIGQDPQGEFSAAWQPEGFPQGFFLQHFTGLRRLEEPVKDHESIQAIDNKKADNEDTETITAREETPRQVIPNSYILPFPSLIPQMWPAASHHQPVYVYSYRQPNGYNYGYHY